MKTEIISMTEDQLNNDGLAAAGKIIKSGGIVAFPTETVYGLGGNALDKEASKKIYAAKGRPSDNPLIVHISDINDLETIADGITEKAQALANVCWPGPLTLIFKKKDIVPKETTGGLDTVAVRFPSNKIAQAFIKEAGGFVAAPSANLSGRPSTTKASHVIEDMQGRIDMIIDGGDSDIGLESTILDMTSDPPVICRPGYFNKENIEAVIGKIDVDDAIMDSDSKQAPKAPGMKYRHYAPHAKMLLVEGEKEAVVKHINELIENAEKDGLKTSVLCSEETKDLYRCKTVFSLGKLTDEDEIAHRLFDVLRENDEMGVEFICSESFYTPALGKAIMNRLNKAAGFNIINV